MRGAMRGWADWLWLKPLERIAPTWCYRTRDLYVVQGRYTRTLVVAEPPESVGPLWLSPLLELGGDVTVSIQAVPYTEGETTRLLRLRRTQHLSEMKERARLGRIDSPEERLRYESATRTEEHIRAGGTKLFHTGVAVTLRADTVRALAGLEQRAAEFFTRIGATAWPLTNEHPAGFRETAPTMRRLLARDMDFDTTTLAYSFLFNASNVGMPAGPIFGVSRRDRRPLRYDPWNRALGVEAPHVGILAPTGTGKTVCAWNLVCELLCAGAGEDTPEQVILVDPKADYTRGVAYFGGVTLRWGVRESDGGTINALQINPGQDFTEVAQTVLGLIALATSTPAFPLSPATTGLWEAAIRGAYAAFGITANDPRSWLETAEGAPRTARDYPTLAHVYAQVAEGGPWDTPTLAQALYPWAMGTYARLVARPTTVDVAAHIVSFDLESLTHGGDAGGRLRAVASFLIGVWTWGLARAHPAWRVLVLDEVETLLAHPETALLVGNWLALGRSYRLQVIHMSQRYTGYTATEQGKRAIENTPTLVFLQQAGGENITQIAAAFALSTQRVKFLRTARKGTPGVCGTEALMVTPRGQEEIEIVPPPEVLNVLLHGTRTAPGAADAADEARVLEGLARQMATEGD